MSPEAVLELIKGMQPGPATPFLSPSSTTPGMRIGEALGLRHADVDLADGVIWVIPRSDNEKWGQGQIQAC